MTHVDILSLAKLARLEVTAEEVSKLEKEIPGILGFIERIQSADVSDAAPEHILRNVMREDGNPHESGAHTEDLIKAAPAQKDNRIVVKQVISRSKK